VWFPDKSGQTAKIISTDHDLDIALLEVPTGAAIHAIPSGLRSPHVGENVSIIAYGIHRSDPRRAEFVRGVVTGSGATSVSDRITVIRAALQPGTSGAPVIGSAGTLLGVIIGRYTAVPELAVSVSATDLAVFLSRNGITIPSAIGPTELTADPDALLSAISVLVQCTPV
jgi:S1-C subfamily serine protease